MSELKYKEITEKIIGASFEVHKFLGNGFQEVIYQRALAWEFSQRGLLMHVKLSRKYFTKNCKNRLVQDVLILLWEGKVLVELKAIIQLGRCSSCASIELS